MDKERFPICKTCDDLSMPHASFINCKDAQLEWLRFNLNKANNKIEVLMDVIKTLRS